MLPRLLGTPLPLWECFLLSVLTRAYLFINLNCQAQEPFRVFMVQVVPEWWWHHGPHLALGHCLLVLESPSIGVVPSPPALLALQSTHLCRFRVDCGCAIVFDLSFLRYTSFYVLTYGNKWTKPNTSCRKCNCAMRNLSCDRDCISERKEKTWEIC